MFRVAGSCFCGKGRADLRLMVKNPASTHNKECTIIPIVSGPQGNAGFISSPILPIIFVKFPGCIPPLLMRRFCMYYSISGA